MDQRDELVARGYQEREDIVRTFFAEHAQELAQVCHRMAERFARGGRLIAFGVGAAATDAQHVAVEFVHPVIVGKRALPALALVNDVASTLGLAAQDRDGFFRRQLEIVGTPEDIALGIVHGRHDLGVGPVAAALKQASALGMLPVSLSGGGVAVGVDEPGHGFEVRCDDPFIVQEVHETLYHVLWELVHVFFEHKGLLADPRAGPIHDVGRPSFLYPFLAHAESDLDSVLDEVRGSILQKAEDVIALRRASSEVQALLPAARAIAERADTGGKVLAFGNGGSATDAQDLVADLVVPPPGMEPLPAISLTNDVAVVTAVGNDVGFDNVFARQVIAYGGDTDVAVAISTSGGSRNVLAGIEEAQRRGQLTIGLVGYGGGRLAEMCDHALIVDGDYIPRIQEAQASQYHLLRTLLAITTAV